MRTKLAIGALGLCLTGCARNPEEAAPEAPDLPVVVQQPALAPAQPPAQAQSAPRPNRMNPYARVLQEAAQGQPAPQPGNFWGQPPAAEPPVRREDPMPTFQEIFSKYAAAVAAVERSTVSIPYRDTKRRVKYYWDPINQTAVNLQTQHSITPDLLAQIIQLGLRAKWPTADPGDAAALAKMMRRFSTERTLAMHRAQADAGSLMLDRLINARLQQQTAISVARDAAFEAWARRQIGVR